MSREEETAVWKECRTLEHARRDKERVRCEAIGHNWRFSNFGPLGHAWHHCTTCGKSRVDGAE